MKALAPFLVCLTLLLGGCRGGGGSPASPTPQSSLVATTVGADPEIGATSVPSSGIEGVAFQGYPCVGQVLCSTPPLANANLLVYEGSGANQVAAVMTDGRGNG